ncbi:MAG: hypothetical protein MJ107_05260, partial [Lachnospiraceae bacterium]|nr:hypothetical protein [Lachnospiraceae bacterium]
VDKLVTLSKKEIFELVFFLSPYAVFSEEERAVYNGIQEYADSIGIPFINFIDEAETIGYDPAVDMMNDFHHCNMAGAAKVTGYMGSFLSENYNLESHKGNEKYNAWDMDLKMYNQIRVTDVLFASKSQEAYFELLAKMNYVEVLLSTEGEDMERIAPYLEMFGIPKEEALKGGKWLYKDKKAIKIEPGKSEESTIVDLDRFVSVKVSESENAGTNVIYNQWPICFTENGLNVIVYDTLFNKSIDVRGF